MKLFVRFFALTIAFIGAAWGYGHFTQSGPLGEDFRLVDSNGNEVTQTDIRAQPAAIFFGYTMCPDFCPTTLMDLTRWLDEMGEDGKKLKIWFFTVDPERDTPDIMRDYLANFAPDFTGITGSSAMVRQTISSFDIVAQRVEGRDGDYTYDHTAAVILLEKGGRKAGIIPYGESDDIALKRLKNLVKAF